jgi:hypothetical protein
LDVTYLIKDRPICSVSSLIWVILLESGPSTNRSSSFSTPEHAKR